MSQQQPTVGFSTITVHVRLPALAVPLRRMIQKTYSHSADRPSGELLLEEVVDFSPRSLLADLKKTGYVLINVRCELRGVDSPQGRYAAAFDFAHRNSKVIVSPWFENLRGELERELVEILRTHLWRLVRVFSVPLYEGGMEVPGVRLANIVLKDRNSDSDAAPTHFFRFTDNALFFEECRTSLN